MNQKSHRIRHFVWRIILVLTLSISLTPPLPTHAGNGVWTSDGPYGGNVQDIAFSPGFAQDQTLFVATTQGVYKSTNGGDNWLRASQGLTVTHVTALALAPDYTESQTLFAGTAGGGVFKSQDGGGSWTPVNP